MKIALIGYGKMGKMVELAAVSLGHQVVARIEKGNLDENSLMHADVCIEFTEPVSVIKNIEIIAQLKKPIVIGTTGWYESLSYVEEIVKLNQIGAIYSPNFSIGAQIFFKTLDYISKLIGKIEGYDVAGIEYHHKQKKDAPSGTAKALSQMIKKNMPKAFNTDFASIRCGEIPGTHQVLFDSAADTITCSHEAKNREGFARGSVLAAEWIRDKKGLFTFDACMDELFK